MENTIKKSRQVIFEEVKKQLTIFFQSNDLKVYTWNRVTIGFGKREKSSMLYRLLRKQKYDEFGLLYADNIKEKRITLKSYKKEFTQLTDKLNLNIFGEPYSITIIEDFND